MNTNLVRILLAAIFSLSALAGFSADAPKAAPPKAAASSAQKELQAVVAKIQAKLREGQKTEKELDSELQEFDTLLAKHKDEKTDDVAQILFMKAMLYTQIFDNTEKGKALLEQIKKDFPDTKQAKNVEAVLANMEQQEASKKIQRSLAVGSKFPDFSEKDVTGKPVSIAGYKGKVVLLDFWATWCGPCVKELPNVLDTYKKHHPKGFDIIGISLDQSQEKLNDFTKENGMTWQQFFDGKGWGNKLAVKYGVNSIPATYLLDGEGKILGKDLRGEDLEKAVTAALAKK